jgi:hypothetical protein
MHAIGSRTWPSRPVAGAWLRALLGIGSCAPTTVQTEQDYRGAALPRPDRVIVYDFAVWPDEVTLDRGISADLMRSF